MSAVTSSHDLYGDGGSSFVFVWVLWGFFLFCFLVGMEVAASFLLPGFDNQRTLANL